MNLLARSATFAAFIYPLCFSSAPLHGQSNPVLAFSNYVKAVNAEVNDQFGGRVVIDGDLMAVGAYYEDGGTASHAPDDDSQPESGAVYIWRRSGFTWEFEAYLKAPNAGPGDIFGWTLDLSGDWLAVGAYFEDGSSTSTLGAFDNNATDAGAVYMYRRSVQGGVPTWSCVQYLKAYNANADDWFGFSLDLQDDILVVAAHMEDGGIGGVDTPGAAYDNSRPSAGAVYTFVKNTSGFGAPWLHASYMKAPVADTADFYGFDVCLSGNRLVVGAPGESSQSGNGADNSVHWSGAAYIYERNTSIGPGWGLVTTVKASNPGVDDFFGWSVSMDGDRLAVGACFEDGGGRGLNPDQLSNSAPDSGAAYVFRRQAAGPGGMTITYPQIAYLKSTNSDPDDRFGNQVDLHQGKLLVAAEFEDSAGRGIGSTQASNAATNAGAAYLYDLDAGFAQLAYIKAPNSLTNANFGHQCWFRDGMIVIGARNECNAASGINGNMFGGLMVWSGAAYHYMLGAPDCDRDGLDDRYELATGTGGTSDCDGDGVLDDCEFAAGAVDCNLNGRLDHCDVAAGAGDCDLNLVPDACDLATGAVPDADANGVPDGCQSGGTPYCFGDGTGSSCPCSNLGGAGRGCASATNPAGAHLSANGVASVSMDSLRLVAQGMPIGTMVALMQGSSMQAPAPFGDGLRCISGTLRVLARRLAGSEGVQIGNTHGPGQIPWQGGVMRYYQAWYEDPTPGFCTPKTTNTTNAVGVLWVP